MRKRTSLRGAVDGANKAVSNANFVTGTKCVSRAVGLAGDVVSTTLGSI